MAADDRSNGAASRTTFCRLEALFDRVAETPDDQRARAVEDACLEAPDLGADLRALLAAHDRLRAHGDDEDVGIAIGTLVGAYRVTEKIGEGGMGEVYRAERADGLYAQQVAIKLLRSAIGRADVRRFTIERQILATLRHEHIVRLLDGGTTAAGQPYLVMEHVEGVPLISHGRERQLALEARLRLFHMVCRAVQYAHQHGIVHRDLKPTNILVDREGMVKIVDFGIAKLLDNEAGADVTATGVAGPLTPNYASPEQLRGLPVTTVSDVYSLGIVLYELVGGMRPYETAGLTTDRLLDVVLNGQPRRPSAAEGSAPLPYARDGLRGDIDAIVLKAIAKNPADRYASASELGEDIARFLARDPVLARVPSTAYVLRRLAVRHKRLVSLAAIALVAILTASAVAAWQWRAAAKAQARAEQRFRDVRQLANALIFKIHDAVVPLAGSTPVRRTIVDEALGYLEKLEAESGGDPALRLELANAYRQIGGILGDVGAANLGDREGAIKRYERARQMLQPLATDSADHEVILGLVDAELRLSTLYGASGDRAHSVALAREAVARATRQLDRHPADDRASDLAARAHFGLAMVLSNEEAPPAWRRTLDYYERILARRPGDPQAQRNVALAAKYLGSVLETTRDWDGARAQYKRALDLDEARLAAAPDDPRVQFDAAISFSNSASVEAQLENVAVAADLFERSLTLRRRLAEIDPTNVQALGRLGYLLARVAHFHEQHGDPAVGLRYAHEAIPLLQKIYDSTGFVSTRGDLGFAWLQLGFLERKKAGGRADAGCEAFRQATAALGDPDSTQLARNHVSYARNARLQASSCAAGR